MINQYNKELFDEGDLNWYDYGFRNYDAQIGRFVQIDPLTDEYALVSGYQYALNDPISNVDVFGLFANNVLQQVMCQGDKLVRTSALLAAGKATSVLANTIAQGVERKVAMQQVTQNNGKTLKEIYGKHLYELDEDEFQMFSEPDTREELLGGRYVIRYTIMERLYLAGSMLGFASPTAKAPRMLKFLPKKKSSVVNTKLDVVKRVLTAYQEALAGGRHAGWLKTVSKWKTSELQASIKTMEVNIVKHQNLISNPSKYLELYEKGNWNLLHPKQQQHLLNVKWPGDIQRAKEQINIIQGILKSR